MSAIAGIYHMKDPVPPSFGQQMMHVLHKFPSDDRRIWRQENLFFGCHAQWITPESMNEPLPFYDDERQLVITSDAIIDNRDVLFDRLGIVHKERKVMPDSQLILLAYDKWQEEVPRYLLGDFAFMIWDEQKQRLFGARDFSGARSLYYFRGDQRFAFCTVMEPLLTLPYVQRRLNESWLAEYLAISTFIDAVDVSHTVLEDIQQVPPSHTITVSNGSVKLRKYHVLSLNEKIRCQHNEEYTERFRAIFQQATDARLRTFKSVGSHLSGGLDSGAVASFAAKTLQTQHKTLHTYSSIPQADFHDYTPKNYFTDERPYIRATVDYVGNIEEHYLRFADKNPYHDIDDWLDMLESPYKFFENSFWMKGIFEQARQEDIGILLSGARGNFTISWGPALEYYGYLLKRLKWMQLGRELQQYSRTIGIGRKRLLSLISQQAFPFLDKETDPSFPMLIHPHFADKMKVFDKLQVYGMDANGFTDLDLVNQRTNVIESEFIWNGNGIASSKLSLRYGLWMRDPTNDVRVIQYCMSLPLKQFINCGMDRALIRHATKGYLPDKVRLNQTNYGIQAADWLHRMIPYWQEFIDEVNELLRDKEAATYLNMDSIRRALSAAIEQPKAAFAFKPELRLLMRGIIVYRFLKTFKGGDTYEKGMERTKVGIVGC
ncbi:asparagine synthase-related protein [Gracilibacillus timonensis]|uniref:asparagine synthase-related protein n=1 Tax=Gracilibacillus timonensis TaxID=1816696 RepID=UPI000826B5FB|nr:asparagine synthase-related protein [Gracilibacillus timonensis]